MKRSSNTLNERIRRAFLPSLGGRDEHIYSTVELRRILERERARADRNEKSFSFVVFNMKKLHQAEYKTLVQLLKKRIRLTDIIGWLDSNNLAVLLYETTVEGARAFATNLIQLAMYDSFSPAFSIYTHPTDLAIEDMVECESDTTDLGQGLSTIPLQVPDGNGKKPTEKQVFMQGRKKQLQYTVNEGSLLPILAKPAPLWKRIMDVACACMALLILSPLFLVIGIFIYTVSSGPIFYKQTRIGHAGLPFTFWKFRTMKINAKTESHEQHMEDLIKQDIPMAKLDHTNDPRIIPFGKFLRTSCLDELPQLFNVLIGDMSIVGPRPCLPYEAAHYMSWQSERFLVLPGMTGSWQVNGKNRMTFKEMMRLDISYSRQVSIWSDIKILFKTLPAIIELVREDRKKS